MVGMNTTAGSILINEHLPEDIRDHSRVYNKRALRDMLSDVGRLHPHLYGPITKAVKDLGDIHAYHEGSSFSFDDLAPQSSAHIKKKYEGRYKAAKKEKDEVKRNDMLRDINMDLEGEINGEVAESLKKPTRFNLCTSIGAKGGPANVRQMFWSSGNQVDVKND